MWLLLTHSLGRTLLFFLVYSVMNKHTGNFHIQFALHVFIYKLSSRSLDLFFSRVAWLIFVICVSINFRVGLELVSKGKKPDFDCNYIESIDQLGGDSHLCFKM